MVKTTNQVNRLGNFSPPLPVILIRDLGEPGGSIKEDNPPHRAFVVYASLLETH